MKIAANISLMFKELLVSMASMVGHIQFADAPGIGAEYYPAGRTETGLGWLDQWRVIERETR